MPHLSALNGPSTGQRYDLNVAESVMGRHPDCQIIIEIGAVSRYHAKIISSPEGMVLEDLKSRNGTFVNGEQIAGPIVLADGDLIRICDLEFSFSDGQNDDGLSQSFSVDGSSLGILMVDDPADTDTASRAVMNRMEVRGSSYGSQLGSSSEGVLAAVLEIMQSLGGSIELDAVLQKILDALFKIFLQADRGFIVLKETDGALIPRWVKTRRDDQDDTVRISKTVLNKIMEDREAIISLDATADERFEMSQSVADFRIRSMIVAPLLNSEGDAIGAIQIDTLQQRSRFEEKDLEVLVAVANQAGIAISNAQLHEAHVQQKMVEQDLQLAKTVQAAFLPQQALQKSGYQCYQFYRAANEIGGDYFDYIHLTDYRVAICLADVVGHGIAAAMFMAKLSAETRFTFARESDPAKAMELLNARLYALGIEKMVTMIAVVIDLRSGESIVVNAGHMPPLLRRASGALEEPSETEAGFPLGIMDESPYEAAKFQLAPGDCFALYTDGIFEAPNPAGEQFSIARVRDLVVTSSGQVHPAGEQIIRQVDQHIGSAAQEDDMCLVIFGRNKA